MIYKFTVLSDEVDSFVRVINIDPEATFFDLHTVLLDSVNFDKNQMTSFFICSDDWEKEQEITLIEMDSSSEYDNLVMEDTKLEELITDEKQKLLYVFDMIADRAFFIELSDIIPGKSVAKPEVVSAEGKAPAQLISDDAMNFNTAVSVDENFYGDEDFDMDELDEEGFGDMNFDDSTLFADDSKF